MKSRFTLYTVAFNAVGSSIDTSALHDGGLRGLIDTTNAETVVNHSSVELRFMTDLTEEQILHSCDEVKKSLEKTGDGRFIYTIKSISL